jgi:hypothetical protein
MKILFLLFLIAVNTSNVFGATAPEKEKFEGGFQRLMSFMHSTFPKGRGEKAEITADNPLANFALEFADKATLDQFCVMKKVSIKVAPFLEEYSVENDGRFSKGASEGIPYTVVLDKSSMSDLLKYGAGKPTLVPVNCDVASNGKPGHYYLWDKFQVVKLGCFQMAQINGIGEEHPFISYNERHQERLHYWFPFDRGYTNNVASHHWGILNIRLSWTEGDGWSFSPFLLNRNGQQLASTIRDTSMQSPKKKALQLSCRANGQARRVQDYRRFVVEEIGDSSGGAGAAAGGARSSRGSKVTADEESIESED